MICDTGTITNEAVFFPASTVDLPDGSTVDAEGYLWNCRYDGGCIVRVAPEGKIDRVIEMPVRKDHDLHFWRRGSEDAVCDYGLG